jgi:hypothetical protein
MKVRLIITARDWAHKLHARRDEQGGYYVQLADQGGQALKHGLIVGGFGSLDAIVANAPQIYAKLLPAGLPAPLSPNP